METLENGQAQGLDSGEHLAHVAADHVASVAADPFGGFQVADPLRNPSRSGRPSAAGSRPRSGRRARCSDSRPMLLIFPRTRAAPLPRWCGSCSATHRLAALDNQGWLIVVNDSLPGARRPPDPKCLWPVRRRDR